MKSHTLLRILPAAALALALPHAARADQVKPPPVPAAIQVPAGAKAFLEGHGVGTQNYVCLPAITSGTSAFAWTLFTPQATLFADDGKQLTTHFFGPNPVEGGRVRVAWQHSRDTSSVWGQLVAPSSDPAFVAPGAIPWLLIQVVGTQAGPDGGDTLTAARYIQRLNTAGGVAPATGCAAAADVGKQAFVPYTADYFFFLAAE